MRLISSLLSYVALLLFSAYGLFVYALLAFPIYWPLYNPALDHFRDEIVTFQVLFYASFAVHVVSTLTISGVLAALFRVPFWMGVMVGGLWVLVLMGPTVGVLSLLNECEANVSFPIPGTRC